MPAYKEPYAFGQSRTSVCDCPVVSAGNEVTERSAFAKLALKYDERMKEMQDEAYGIAGREDAIEAWEWAIQQMEENDNQEAVIRGHNIAEDLGWELDV